MMSLSMAPVFAGKTKEVATISINWLMLIASGVLLSIVFRRALVESSGSRKASLVAQSALD